MKDKNILVITVWQYNDALVQTYTLPYLDIISEKISENSKIFLVTLEKNEEKIEIKNPKIILVPFKYSSFGFKGILMWLKVFLKLKLFLFGKKIKFVHAWGPSAGMIANLITFLTSKKVIIDSFEPHAESMVENGSWKRNSLPFLVLSFFEKRIAKKSRFLIATTKSYMDFTISKYNISKDKFFIKPACVDLSLFSNKNKKNKELLMVHGLENKIVCVYAGKFGGIYLDQEVFDLIKVAETFWGDKFRFLLLTSNPDAEIEEYRKRANLNEKTIVKLFVPFSEIPNFIGMGDFALTPVKPVPSKQYCTPIKDGEYWALGLPIIITKNISDDSKIISENDIGYVLEDFTCEQYFEAIKKIDILLSSKSSEILYDEIRKIAISYRSFEIAENIYSKIYS